MVADVPLGMPRKASAVLAHDQATVYAQRLAGERGGAV
jgi:hypothetical protein